MEWCMIWQHGEDKGEDRFIQRMDAWVERDDISCGKHSCVCLRKI